MRAGEIVALEWADVDLERRQIRVRHSDWCGELTAPKNGRIRFVGMTERLAAAIRQQRHLRSRRVLCKDDGTPITRQGAWSRVRYAAKRAKVPTGVTFCVTRSARTWRCTARRCEAFRSSSGTRAWQ